MKYSNFYKQLRFIHGVHGSYLLYGDEVDEIFGNGLATLNRLLPLKNENWKDYLGVEVRKDDGRGNILYRLTDLKKGNPISEELLDWVFTNVKSKVVASEHNDWVKRRFPKNIDYIEFLADSIKSTISVYYERINISEKEKNLLYHLVDKFADDNYYKTAYTPNFIREFEEFLKMKAVWLEDFKIVRNVLLLEESVKLGYDLDREIKRDNLINSLKLKGQNIKQDRENNRSIGF